MYDDMYQHIEVGLGCIRKFDPAADKIRASSNGAKLAITKPCVAHQSFICVEEGEK